MCGAVQGVENGQEKKGQTECVTKLAIANCFFSAYLDGNQKRKLWTTGRCQDRGRLWSNCVPRPDKGRTVIAIRCFQSGCTTFAAGGTTRLERHTATTRGNALGFFETVGYPAHLRCITHAGTSFLAHHYWCCRSLG